MNSSGSFIFCFSAAWHFT